MKISATVLLTAAVAALLVYGFTSIWCPTSFAKSMSWLFIPLGTAIHIVLSILAIVVATVLVVRIWCKSIGADYGEGSECVKLESSTQPENPYPQGTWRRISSFKYHSHLNLMRFSTGLKGVSRKDQYIVAEPYRVSFKIDNTDHCVCIPKGMLTDLSSAPFPFNCIVGRVGPHLEATIVHDYLYIAWQDHGEEFKTERSRRFADRVMFEGMKASGMGCMARIIYGAIRAGGFFAFHRTNDIRYVTLDQTK